jgi:GNAT superfamily N-acetyltransferase
MSLVGPAGGDDAAGVAELYAINVDPDYWGTAGPALIEAGLAALRDHGFTTALWVHPDNARDCRFPGRARLEHRRECGLRA